MSINPHAYNITIRQGCFEGEALFEARVKELPDLKEYGESYEEAYSLAIDAIETSAEAFAEKGREFPVAIVPADEFSGRVTLRLPRSLHRLLAETADTEDVSLNQYLVNVLSYYSGFASSSRIEDLPVDSWRTMTVVQEASRGSVHSHLRLVKSEDLKTVNSNWD